MKCIRLFIFLISISRIYGYFLDHALIKQYLKAKSISFVTFGVCGGKSETFTLIGELMRAQTFTRVVNLDEVDMALPYIRYANFGVVLDGNCPKLKATIEHFNTKYIFHTLPYLLITSNSDDVALESLFLNAPLHINSQVTVAIKNVWNNETWTIYDLYNPGPGKGGELKVVDMGDYSPFSGDSWPCLLHHKFVARGNMTGVTLKAAMVIPDGTNYSTISKYLTDDTDRGSNSQHRFQCTLMGYCRDFYNFTLVTQRTDSWGYTTEDKIDFDGLVGLLQDKSVDIGCTPLIFRSDRLMVIDYCQAGWILRSVFIFRPVSVIPDTISVFTKPLSAQVWWCLLASMGLFVVCLKLVLSGERRMITHVRNAVEESWSYIILNVFGVLCLQGTISDSLLSSGRIVILSMSILCVLIYQFYSGFIVSTLLMSPPRRINSLQDLIDSNLDAGIEDILIDRDFIKYTKDKTILDLYQNKVKKPHHDGFYMPTDGMEKVMNGGFAFHVETSSAYPLMKEMFHPRLLCELQEIQMYHTQFMYSSVQKKSQFRDVINYCVLRMYENGIMHRMRSLWDAQKPKCLENKFVVLSGVGIEEFSAALYILLFGVVVSTLTLLVEIFWYKYALHRANKTLL